ncbi:hypothetical protein RNJ44_02891 [Nakaseomyces bracarensis]|uniref:Uncharacterized protein n=1 Tax=Nakaseomyces bracarensis TaxID=273131 RepID=A0ABR4P0J1_9SACH
MAIFEKLVQSFSDKKSVEQQFPIPKNDTEGVPPILRYNMTRDMPIVKSFSSRAYLIFPSVQSYDIFKQTTKNDGVDSAGMGVPLLQAIPPVVSTWRSTGPLLVIHKYIVLPRSEPAPYSKFEIVFQDNNFNVYKIPFCEITWQYSGLHSRRFDFKFTDPNIRAPCYFESQITAFDKKGVTEGCAISWKISRVPFMVGKLKISGDVPTLPGYEEASNEKRSSAAKDAPTSKVTQVSAYYTKRFQDEVPKMTSRRADLIIGEFGDITNLGITGVSMYSQIFACQALLIHFLEHIRHENSHHKTTRKQRRAAKHW